MNTDNKNWLTTRLNKDNFWSLMFWLGMTISGTISALFSEMAPILGSLIFWGSLVAMALLIRGFNSVTYTDKQFFNSQGQNLNKYPTNLFWPIVSTIVIMVLSGLFLDKFAKNIPELLTSSILNSILFMVPALYFIFMNCPISILFNKHAWNTDANGADPKTKFYNPHSHSLTKSGPSALSNFMKDNPITDPAWKGSSSNIFNSNRHK